MTPLLFIYLLLILVLLALVAFFSGTETAVTSANRLSMEEKAEQGDKRAKLVIRFLNDFERFLSTVLMGTNLINVALVTIAGLVIENYLLKRCFPELPETWTETVTAIIITPVILVFGEILPKAVARQRSEAFSLRTSRALKFSSVILAPLVMVITWLSNLVQKLFGLSQLKNQENDQASVTREDLFAIAEIATEQGIVQQEAGDMLQIVLEMDQKPVSDAMTPLVDITSLPENATMADVERLTSQTGFSRFPVYRNRVDNIIGVVGLRQLIKDLQDMDLSEEAFLKQPIQPYINDTVLFVPETKPINQLLSELRKHHLPMAIVVDEYGGMIGLVTIEDLTQQIVGAIQDYGEQDEQPDKRSENEIVCDGRTPIREIEDYFDEDIDNEGFVTIAGLVLKLSGNIPRPNEMFSFKDFQITVLEIEAHRIVKLKIVRKNSSEVN